MNNKYFGKWTQLGDLRAFHGSPYSDSYADNAAPVTEDELLHASYDVGGFNGAAFVLFERDGKLYEVNAGYCSCHGLEGQWDPTETTWKALAMRWCRPCLTNLSDDVRAMQDLIVAHLPN